LTGSLEESLTKVEQLRKWDLDVPSPICATCFGELSSEAHRRYGPDFSYLEDPPEDLQASIESRINSIQVFTFNPYNEGAYKNLGLASGYVTLGTGPISSLALAASDFLGQDSQSYNNKMLEAQKACLRKLKENAHQKGATAVIGLLVSVSELTHGHGAILFSMLGTAVSTR
jgi:uncharacterized protein YbjQ (UPF0145 family)